MPVAVKICGLTDEGAIRAAISAGANYAGFVFYPASFRHLESGRAAELKKLLPPAIKSVSVLVDPDDALLEQVKSVLAPDYLQLHGSETPERLREIKKRFGIAIIKGIPVHSADDITAAMRFADCADMLLFDAKAPMSSLPGGTGTSFDWNFLNGKTFLLPWFLSGGLNVENVAEAIRVSGAKMVDVSSGVERAPGVKDEGLIEAFVKAAKNA